MIVRLGDLTPHIDPTAWVAPTADVIGHVTLHEGSSVWYAAVVRADDAPITLGARSNLQDGVVVHSDPGRPVSIGAGVTVGHKAIVHGCTVEDDCLIGMGATLLNHCHIGAGSLVAAGAVVTEGTVVPPRSLVAGTPARVLKPVDDALFARILDNASAYVALARRHREQAAPTMGA